MHAARSPVTTDWRRVPCIFDLRLSPLFCRCFQRPQLVCQVIRPTSIRPFRMLPKLARLRTVTRHSQMGSTTNTNIRLIRSILISTPTTSQRRVETTSIMPLHLRQPPQAATPIGAKMGPPPLSSAQWPVLVACTRSPCICRSPCSRPPHSRSFLFSRVDLTAEGQRSGFWCGRARLAASRPACWGGRIRAQWQPRRVVSC